VRLRRARPADAPALAALRWEFRAALARTNETRRAFLKRCTPWMRGRLSPGSGWLAWIAEERGRILGHLWLATIEKVPNPVAEAERHAYVTNVYVRPENRGARLGERLMAAAVSWCESHDVASAILWPTRKSRSLYARHGFGAATGLMERPRSAASRGRSRRA